MKLAEVPGLSQRRTGGRTGFVHLSGSGNGGPVRGLSRPILLYLAYQAVETAKKKPAKIFARQNGSCIELV
jgi:hypothetical protein